MQTQVGAMKYGMSVSPNYSADVSGVANGAVTTTESHASSISMENPMIWLFVIGAVTLGLVAFSTHVRIGKFSADVKGGS